jgi:hypothetical protein
VHTEFVASLGAQGSLRHGIGLTTPQRWGKHREKQKVKGEKKKRIEYKKQKVNNEQGLSGVQQAQKDPHVHD